MKTRTAVLRQSGLERPYSQSIPLSVIEVELEPPQVGEVLVRIEAAGLCHSDLSTINGNRPRPMPMAMGHEAAGCVIETGVGVEDVGVGDKVVLVFVPSCASCDMCARGRPGLCRRASQSNAAGELLRGGVRWQLDTGEPLRHHLGVSAFSEYVVVDRRSLVVIDGDIPAASAALFGCAVMTGAGAVLNTAMVRPGESVAIFGLGGVGLAAIMGASLVSAFPIIAVDPVRSKRDKAMELGATHVLEPAEAHDEIEALCAGGVDYAFEAVGNAEVLRNAWDATTVGGMTVSVGLAHPSQELRLSAAKTVAEGRTLVGSYLGDSAPEVDIPRFARLWRAGKLPIEKLQSAELGLNQINGGLEALASGDALRQMIIPTLD